METLDGAQDRKRAPNLIFIRCEVLAVPVDLRRLLVVEQVRHNAADVHGKEGPKVERKLGPAVWEGGRPSCDRWTHWRLDEWETIGSDAAADPRL
eukprot:scaffold926_cov248-Pinguiococcus_pyrenoidosus.AAC.6